MCLNRDIFCEAVLEELEWIGIVSFIVLAIGSLIQIYDIYKMGVYFSTQNTEVDYQQEKQDNLRHFTTIGHYLVGVTLNLFGLAMMEV